MSYENCNGNFTRDDVANGNCSNLPLNNGAYFCDGGEPETELVTSPISRQNSATRRKQLQPRRSASMDDPEFRGVSITMETKMENFVAKLVISSSFRTMKTNDHQGLSRARSRRRCTSEGSAMNFTDSAGDEEEECRSSSASLAEEKHCASCSVKKTPLWRDAEDGTPLCNACGIRYKKYKIRCTRCWHIPKKDEFSPTCRSCGAGFQYALPKTW